MRSDVGRAVALSGLLRGLAAAVVASTVAACGADAGPTTPAAPGPLDGGATWSASASPTPTAATSASPTAPASPTPTAATSVPPHVTVGSFAPVPPTAAAAACDLPPLAFRAAQVLLVGIPGTTAAEGGEAAARAGVGGVLLFGGNLVDAGQVRVLTAALQAAADVPLAIATDEEPGRIGRLAGAGIIPPTPSARTLGRDAPATIMARALRIGRAMAALGLTADLAPILDVTGAEAGGVIGDRSFGADPTVVARAGVAFADGLAAAGIAAVGKHFPGHGETTADSHAAPPLVTASLATLRRRAFPPFEAAIDAGIPAIMLGHLSVPAIDPSRPSSLSAPTIDLLRKGLGFDGLVMTDDLYMGGIAERWKVATAVELALRAGVDMVLLSTSADVAAVTDAIVAAVEAGRLPVERLTEAFLRVERFKGVDRWAACSP